MIVGRIHQRCSLQTLEAPNKANKQIIKPAYGGPEVPPIPPQYNEANPCNC